MPQPQARANGRREQGTAQPTFSRIATEETNQPRLHWHQQTLGIRPPDLGDSFTAKPCVLAPFPLRRAAEELSKLYY